MPIINLKLQGKQAIGDGSKIVCMNGDYTVQLECVDCEDFVALPFKKLILKAGTEYQESPISKVTVSGKQVLQAELPLVEDQKTVEIGVYGQETENGEPEYASKPAVFECEKSILCGTIVLRKEPTLDKLVVSHNGKYLAADRNADGFYEVDVSVGSTPAEVRTVELSMAGGSQVIDPSSIDRVMSQVIVTKPLALAPENIKKGIGIGGVVGTFDKVLTETEIFSDGEYVPPSGVDGFSRVVVSVGNSNYAKLIRIGESFSYDYDTSVNIVLDTPGVVKYENNGEAIIFTGVGNGSCSVVLKDFDSMGNVVNTVHYAIIVELESDFLTPAEASDLATMELYLKEGVVGSVVKYTGTTLDGFVKDELYIIEGGE